MELLSADIAAFAPVVVAVGIAEGGPIGRVFAQLLALKPNHTVCQSIAPSIPNLTVALRDLHLEVRAQMVRFLRSGNLPEVSFIELEIQNDIGASYYECGDYDKALAQHLQALDVWRRRAEESPEVNRYFLARTLSNIAWVLYSRGSADDALVFAQEALELKMQLPLELDRFQASLAKTHSILGNIYALLAQERAMVSSHENETVQLCRREAVRWSEEAVTEWQHLKDKESDEFREDEFAVALHNLACWLVNVGAVAEALCHSQKAIGLMRGLAVLSPDAFRPKLPNILRTLATAHKMLGQVHLGCEALEEATELLKQLAMEQPRVFLANLALCQSELAESFIEIGKPEHAAVYAEGAVTGFQRLLGEGIYVDPVALERGLLSLAKALDRLRLTAAQLEIWRISIEFHRRELKTNAGLFLPVLAQALFNYGTALFMAERFDESIVHLTEAADLYNECAQSSATDEAKYQNCLNNLRAAHDALSNRAVQRFIEKNESPLPAFRPIGENWLSLVPTARLSTALVAQCAASLSQEELIFLERLMKLRAPEPDIIKNAEAVCLLRIGKSEDALELLRPMVYVQDSLSIRSDLPTYVKTNCAIALLLCGKVTGCESILTSLNEEEAAATRQAIRAVIAFARKSLNWIDRLKAATGDFPKPITLPFPAGEFFDSGREHK